MAIDTTRPLKLESPAEGGTQTDDVPTEMNPAEDYAAVKGIAFESNTGRLFDLSASGEIQYKDAVQTTYRKLNDITSSGVFGTLFTYAESNGASSTTSGVFQTKLTLTSLTLVSGDYWIQWSMELKNSSGGKETQAQVLLGLTEIARVSDIPGSNTGAESYAGYAGIYRASSLVGVQTVTMNYRAVNDTASIRRARIAIWRIS